MLTKSQPLLKYSSHHHCNMMCHSDLWQHFIQQPRTAANICWGTFPSLVSSAFLPSMIEVQACQTQSRDMFKIEGSYTEVSWGNTLEFWTTCKFLHIFQHGCQLRLASNSTEQAAQKCGYRYWPYWTPSWKPRRDCLHRFLLIFARPNVF